MKKHILLIDNNKSELTIFMAALKEIQGNFKCSHAESSEQALAMLEYIQPDFIFVSHNLPHVNGLQIISVIRNEPVLERSKVYTYTEMISEEISKMARLLGASGCIEKSAEISWLIHLFKAIFDGQLMPGFAILKNPAQAERLQLKSDHST
jgi:two-component system chemotaxis response regulator CheY